MSFINKPKVAHPSLPTNALGLTRRQYEGSMSTLCAGCGHDSVTAAIIEACWGLDMRPEQLVKLSGIGSQAGDLIDIVFKTSQFLSSRCLFVIVGRQAIHLVEKCETEVECAELRHGKVRE